MPSAVIRAFRYLAPERELEITFQSGRVYTFLDVPPELAREMRETTAKGTFFNNRIRGAFAFEHRNARRGAQPALAWTGS